MRSDADSTCWSVIGRAAAGSQADRESFVHRYRPVIRAYLGTRWRSPALRALIDDATQDVFFECFRPDGVLAHANPGRVGGFRPFLFGVVLNISRRIERKHFRQRELTPAGDVELDGLASSDETQSAIWDREWAKALVHKAAKLAADSKSGGARRAELLRLRFFEGLPIRDIAQRWQVDPAHLHQDYAKARKEFIQSFRTLVADHNGGSADEIDAYSRRLLDILRHR